MAVPYYDRTQPELVGQPYLMGMDEHGNQTYFMGMWNQRENITGAIRQLLNLAGVDRTQYIFQDAFPLINFSTKVGGLLSKRYRLTNIGRWVTVWGMRRQYPQFVDLVTTVKKRLNKPYSSSAPFIE